MPGKMMGDVGKLRRHRIEPARKEQRRHREHLLLRLEARIAAPCGNTGQQVVALALIAFVENRLQIFAHAHLRRHAFGSLVGGHEREAPFDEFISEEPTSEPQSLMSTPSAAFCMKKKTTPS